MPIFLIYSTELGYCNQIYSSATWQKGGKGVHTNSLCLQFSYQVDDVVDNIEIVLLLDDRLFL